MIQVTWREEKTLVESFGLNEMFMREALVNANGQQIGLGIDTLPNGFTGSRNIIVTLKFDNGTLKYWLDPHDYYDGRRKMIQGHLVSSPRELLHLMRTEVVTHETYTHGFPVAD